MSKLLKNSWYSARGLKKGLLLSLLASLVWIAGVYGFMQAQEATNPEFKMIQVSYQHHNYAYKGRT